MRKPIHVSILAIAFGIACTGCHHKMTAATPATPPAPAAAPAPVANITVSPESVQRGQTAELTWSTQNASTVTIDGIGAVDASGTKQITAQESTTYHLTAKGDGGSVEADASLTVTEAPKPVANLTDEELFERNVKDIFFNYDNAAIRNDEDALVNSDAQFLSAHPNMQLLIEGHCDERGSEDYNMVLGNSRAKSVRDALIQQGISADRIKLISFGKEKPFCTTAENDSCWSKNRRAHFVLENSQGGN
ncbi:MAG TPA: peptidoglycan-associated lipoprotein Pal [Candidatus Angelobacter sp.]|nr:peptidoglycan-associated lipoprotein Pal [Candidatus Angelobacter sp.]